MPGGGHNFDLQKSNCVRRFLFLAIGFGVTNPRVIFSLSQINQPFRLLIEIPSLAGTANKTAKKNISNEITLSTAWVNYAKFKMFDF
jgi:hypothetical protein